jgi:hypothetical protein
MPIENSSKDERTASQANSKKRKNSICDRIKYTATEWTKERFQDWRKGMKALTPRTRYR